jgi:hypothetical protein
LKSAATSGVVQNDFKIEIFQYSFSQNHLCALPVNLHRRFTAVLNVGFGLKDWIKR